ncbi:MAG: hypothetical protein ACXWCG_13410, partial [Flavitalea sp.]
APRRPGVASPGTRCDSEKSIYSMQDLLKHFEDADPEKYTRLTRVLYDFHPFLVVNMVKSNTDLKCRNYRFNVPLS